MLLLYTFLVGVFSTLWSYSNFRKCFFAVASNLTEIEQKTLSRRSSGFVLGTCANLRLNLGRCALFWLLPLPACLPEDPHEYSFDAKKIRHHHDVERTMAQYRDHKREQEEKYRQEELKLRDDELDETGGTDDEEDEFLDIESGRREEKKKGTGTKTLKDKTGKKTKQAEKAGKAGKKDACCSGSKGCT